MFSVCYLILIPLAFLSLFIFRSGFFFFFFFQAEDGIRDAQESRGLGDVYKRQILLELVKVDALIFALFTMARCLPYGCLDVAIITLSLIHI